MSSLSFQDIGLKPAVLRAIEKKAKHSGQTAPEYVRTLIERDLLADRSFDEILGPVRQDFSQSGITESQLALIVKRARHGAKRSARKVSQ